ncbi:MAG: putative two-component response regulator [Olpidium bornovanus]|uniref:Two-component response regulator n=1 Tax=Olpidium bornovanus TaxID=278681 RepID=A0A8H8DJK9_9FUNG|nr:MAG: putative two-component response regulator [Olpidium bornovanus]
MGSLAIAEYKGRLSGRRVLLAEDNPVNQKVAILQLRQLGVVADAVNNGAEVLDHLVNAGPFNWVLMDCQMPICDGYQAAAEVRREAPAGLRDIPIIAMTANAIKGDKERCLNAGASLACSHRSTCMNDYLSKPITLPRLASALLKWLKDPPPD